MSNTSDIVVVGGGLVGTAVAYGLVRAGASVTLLDEGDVAHRASRGNFGLVWVQGKGADQPAYARWTRRSADLWPEFAARLKRETGVDPCYRKEGGLHICLDPEEMRAREATLETIAGHTGTDQSGAGGRIDFAMLDRRHLAELVQGLGADVAGASFCADDGHCNPLFLLHALHAAFAAGGGRSVGEAPVERIEPGSSGFLLHTAKGEFSAGRVVLAAGLGSARLAPMVGLTVPVRPQRGQVVVTTRQPPRLRLPTHWLRQTAEGSLMLGDSQEEVGHDEGVTLPVLQTIAARAVRCLPWLAEVPVLRSWGALRVMSPDGLPIYAQSAAFEGAFVVTCHSGVTLAAAHAGALAPAIAEGAVPGELQCFGQERFDVPQAA
ncbi:MAG: FAD-binding oxidoreductase [Geminicoccaceae bacterium]|nr:FAD-binding oxidoreductase [Geminicoccaceae bacterium]